MYVIPRNTPHNCGPEDSREGSSNLYVNAILLVTKSAMFSSRSILNPFLPEIITYADSVVNSATGPTPTFGISDWGRLLFNRSVR